MKMKNAREEYKTAIDSRSITNKEVKIKQLLGTNKTNTRNQDQSRFNRNQMGSMSERGKLGVSMRTCSYLGRRVML